MRRIASATAIVWAALAVCSLCAEATDASPPATLVRLSFPPADVAEVLALDLDVWSLGPGVAELLVASSDLDRLRRPGWSVAVLDDDVYRSSAARTARAVQSDEPWTSHHTLASADAMLADLAGTYPSRCTLLTVGTSIEGRPIRGLRISDDPGVIHTDEPAVLFVGCHHAREWVSVEVPLYLAEVLVTHYDSDAAVRRIVRHAETWIVPVENPDGYVYTQTADRFWRKNRRNNGDGSYGVDTNRNYGYAWGGAGASADPSSPVYRGAAPFSEPETQAIRDLFGASTGRTFSAAISYHSYSQFIMHPWSYTSAPPPALASLAAVTTDLRLRINAAHNDATYDYQSGQSTALLYAASGDFGDWAYGTYGLPAITIELRPATAEQGGFELPTEQILPTCQENAAGAFGLIESFLPPWPSDLDDDTDVDLADFSWFLACFNGPNRAPVHSNCDAADGDADGDVDLVDFASFLACFNGPDHLPACEP